MGRVIVIAALALAACHRGSREEAEAAVRTYTARLIEAYRASDSTIVDPLVGDAHGRKLLGLIGVKHDAGVAMDAKLLELQFTRVEQDGGDWIVETRERWYYLDRRLKTGEQVGDASTDSYALRYRFVRNDKRLVLEDLIFTEEPVVGRKTAPLPMNSRVLHGLPPEDEGSPLAGHPPTVSPPARHDAAGASTTAAPRR